MKHFSLETVIIGKTRVLKVYFDLQGEKVNKFNEAVMLEFESLIGEIQKHATQSEKIDAVVLLSKKSGNFIAGADIQLIQSAKSVEEAKGLARKGQNLLNHWEDLPVPTIVGIQGSCLGGGCELSLASSAIVMSTDPQARIGLPETLLGFIPGMGGCIRMPWKVGIATALDMILTGKNVNGEKAYKMGLADACLQKENFEEALLQWVSKNIEALRDRKPLGRKPALGGMGGTTGALLEGLGSSIVFKKAREGVLSKTKGKYPAPLEAIRVIQETGTGYQENFRGEKRNRALEREAQGFAEMSQTEVSKNCVRLFFLTEAIKKETGILTASANLESVNPKITQAGVLGAGVMGGGIAQLLADKDVTCQMKDVSHAALEIGVQSALSIFKKSLKRKRINSRQFAQKLNRIAPTLDFQTMGVAQVVVEAVVEKMEVKKSVLAEVEKYVSSSCVIATNTSSLSVTEMQKALSNPARFCGMHFFNPVSKMPLVEVIRGEQSSDVAVSQIFQFAKQIGKYPVVVKDSAGFLVNRLLMPYLGEAATMVAEGVSIEKIDALLEDFGMPMGPIELIDEVGLDVAVKVGHILHEAFGSRMTPPKTFDRLVENKHLGKKSNRGFYRYEGPADKKKKSFSNEIYSDLGLGQPSSSVSDQDILDRCILGMVNEAARCLEEKVVERAQDVDLGMIMGTGFPPFHGGLLRYAEARGTKEIVERLQSLSKTYGERFKPSDALLKVVNSGGKFYTT